MGVILGIDPGSRIMGYGIIRYAEELEFVDCGVINVAAKHITERLGILFSGVQDLVQRYRVDVAVLENVFLAKNVQAALKLGQARGAALAAISLHKIPFYEYAPRTIKKSTVGSGAAEKQQVQLMVRYLLNLDFTPSNDAADALAVAICHYNKAHLGLTT